MLGHCCKQMPDWSVQYVGCRLEATTHIDNWRAYKKAKYRLIFYCHFLILPSSRGGVYNLSLLRYKGFCRSTPHLSSLLASEILTRSLKTSISSFASLKAEISSESCKIPSYRKEYTSNSHVRFGFKVSYSRGWIFVILSVIYDNEACLHHYVLFPKAAHPLINWLR